MITHLLPLTFCFPGSNLFLPVKVRISLMLMAKAVKDMSANIEHTCVLREEIFEGWPLIIQ